MTGFTVTGTTHSDAVKAAVDRFGLPEDALSVKEVGGLGERIDDREDNLDRAGVTLQVIVKPDHVADTARLHLLKMLEFMEIHPEIRTVVDGDVVKMNLQSPDSAILIGRGGQTLLALEHLLNRMSTPPGLGGPFVALDVEDYRERRLAALERQARRNAREVVETKEEVELDPMPAADRKIIHMALRSNKTVRTFSRGEGGGRRIVVAPADDVSEHVAPADDVSGNVAPADDVSGNVAPASETSEDSALDREVSGNVAPADDAPWHVAPDDDALD
jgi:spoIIIJ-associated protein